MNYTEFVIPLRNGIINAIEVPYNDDSIIELWVWLKYNQDICFDGVSLSLCNHS